MFIYTCTFTPKFTYSQIHIPGCIFGGILYFFKVLYVFISFKCFLHGFNGSNSFKLLFGPIRLEIYRVSAQMVDSRPESWHFWNAGLPGGLGFRVWV